MSSLERIDCIFQFFGESPQFAVVEEYTCYICIEGSDFDCVAGFLLSNIFVSVLKASIAIIFLGALFVFLCVRGHDPIVRRDTIERRVF